MVEPLEEARSHFTGGLRREHGLHARGSGLLRNHSAPSSFTLSTVLPVSSLLNPVGNKPARVYWRRRIEILVVLVILVLFVGKACSGGSQPVADNTPLPAVTTTSSSTPTPSASTAVSASPTSSPSPTAARTPAKGECNDSQVRVYVTAESLENPVGGPVLMRFVVATNSDTTCLRDVGGSQNEVRITSASGNRIWSSDDCNPGGAANVRPISQSSPYAVTVEWNGKVSKPGCSGSKPEASNGSYAIVARNGDVKSEPEPLILN